MNRYVVLILLSIIVVGCSPKPTGDTRLLFFSETWSIYLSKTLQQAKSHADKLKADTSQFCVSGSITNTDSMKNNWKMTYVSLQRQDFFDFVNGYRRTGLATILRDRLVPKPVDAAAVDKYLTDHSSDQITESSVTSDPNLLGLPVVEYLLYAGNSPVKDDKKCKLLTIITDLAAKDVNSLVTEWETFKNNILEPTKSTTSLWNSERKLLDEILVHSQRFIEITDKDYVAKPSARNEATGEPTGGVANPLLTEAPYSKLGAWMIQQSLIEGLEAYYKGNYDGVKFTNSLLDILKGEDPVRANTLEQQFNAVSVALQPFLPPNSLEEAIKNNTDGDKIKALILALNALNNTFKVDLRDALGTSDGSPTADND